MLHTHIASLIETELPHIPTADQKQLIEGLGSFIAMPNNNTVFVIRGYAGTGKTTIIASLVKALHKLKQQVALMAPTGRASKVLANYSGFQATTIHKKIFRQRSASDTDAKFDIDRNLSTNAVFVVDEASMIGEYLPDNSGFGSGNLLQDLLQYVYSGINCKLIFCGDIAQLPPVGTTLSPALRESSLEAFGKKVMVFTLRDITRQTLDSGILINATNIRTKLAEKNYKLPLFNTNNYKDFVRISGAEFQELLEEKYSKYGIEQVAVITKTNKHANIYNFGIRNSILWYEAELEPSDILMVVKNNYFWGNNSKTTSFIANGDIVRLNRIRKIERKYDFRFAEASITLPDSDLDIDVKIILDTLTSAAPCLTQEQSLNLYRSIEEDYAQIGNKRKRYLEIRNNPYYNALQIKFAYAVTCHKSQGGQWDCVFIDAGYFTQDMLNIEYFRWLYTAVTRAKTELYLVNFSDDFFT